MDCSPPGTSIHGNSPGKNTGVGSHALLQGIFLTQGSNPGFPALQVDSFTAVSSIANLVFVMWGWETMLS